MRCICAFSLLMQVTLSDPIFRLPITVVPEIGILVPLVVNGINLTALVNFNYPDLIVPICQPRSSSPNNACIALTNEPTCAGSDQCFDRALPPWQCKNLELTDSPKVGTHIVGNLAVKAFEWVSKDVVIGGFAAGPYVPLKGQVNDLTGRAIFGIGPKRMSCRNETLIEAMGVNYFALSRDQIAFYESGMGLGIWTEKYLLGSPNISATVGKYAFNAYRPTICGVDLLGNTSSHWTTIIDATVKCLVLPSVIYNSISAWIAGSNNVFYFKLGDQADNTFVAIDLTSVCIEASSKKLTDTEVSVTAKDPIIVGYQALEVILKAGPIGFEALSPYRVQFEGTVDKVDPTCSVIRPACIGNQFYHEPKNVCINPECDRYLFSELDSISMTCVWSSYVPVAVYTTIIVLMLGELLVYALNRKVNSLAHAACEATEART